MFDNVTFEGLDPDDYPIKIKVKGDDRCTYLTENGCWNKSDNAKCVVFPKGRTTWEGFVPPCKFKDGDIVYIKTDSHNHIEFIIIFKEIRKNHIHKHACFAYQHLSINKCAVCHIADVEIMRLATEEEKQKLFDAIKDNGYKWNAETKTLEKLNQPNFKVGNWVVQGCNILKIRCVGNEYYCFETVMGYAYDMLVSEMDSLYHLWTIQDAKDGDVLHSPSHNLIWIYKDNKHYYACVNMNYETENVAIDGLICIPHDACPATKDEQTILFAKMKEADYKWNAETKTLEKLVKPRFKVGDRIRHKENGNILKIVDIDMSDSTYCCGLDYVWVADQDNYELVPDKFDINTLKPFESRVLVRNVDGDLWKPAIYGFPHSKGCYVVGGVYWGQCIPYEENKELLGTTNNPEEYGSR
jgi:hypothetical protein